MGISLIRGRLFSEDDSASTPPVALISETLARRYFPGENPLGRQLIFGFPPHGDVSREIVGVVADIHDVSIASNPGPMMYVPFAQVPFWGSEVERYRGAHNSRVGSEPIAPQLFAQNRHRRSAAFAVFWRQRAAQQRLRSK